MRIGKGRASAREQGRVDGRLVVFLVFGGAFLLWGIAFMTGLQKRQGRGSLAAAAPVPARDSTAHPDTLRAWLGRLPAEWVRITRVEGQGFVILVPCYASNSTLTLRLPADSLPRVDCVDCDSLGAYDVLGAARDSRDSSWELHLNPPAGELRVLSVTDSLLQRFPEAPFQDRILLWIRTRLAAPVAPADATPATPATPAVPNASAAAAGDTARPVASTVTADTLIFVPKRQENEFEVLRAEDENPEGCVPEAE